MSKLLTSLNQHAQPVPLATGPVPLLKEVVKRNGSVALFDDRRIFTAIARAGEATERAGVALVDNYLERLDWQVKENSNMGYSLQGLNNYLSSQVSRQYWLNRIYPESIRQAHESGDFHIHDLGQLSVYCVGWDLYDLLVSGFTGVAGKAQSAPPSHFRSALGQMVNFFYTLQGEAAGAQALSNFDTLLAPFVRFDRLTFPEVKALIRGFVFNLNVPTRVGFQTPFTNITLDLTPGAIYRDQNVVIGGEVRQGRTYGDYADEMAMIDRALFEVLGEGDVKGRVFTFPIPTINIGSDFDWSDNAHAAIWQATARYGIPYFANFINSDLSPDDARSMCCRLRLDTRALEKRGGGLFGANPLTGSIGVVTLNLPRIGLEADSREMFFRLLKERLNLAAKSLEIKRKVIERFAQKGLYPYAAHYLRHIVERFGEHWTNHFSTIGVVGMHEACRHLMKVGIGHPKGRQLARETLLFIRQELQRIQQETGHLYNLEATPAESTGYRLARLDAEQFQLEKSSGYTNSTQLPVDYANDVFEVVRHQDELQSLYTGGTVLHVFNGEANVDPLAVKRFVRTICEQSQMPYITFTPTFSVCPDCGYRAGRHDHCPDCGAQCEVYSRVVGYLRPVDQWNEGKALEFEKRVSFGVAPAPLDGV